MGISSAIAPSGGARRWPGRQQLVAGHERVDSSLHLRGGTVRIRTAIRYATQRIGLSAIPMPKCDCFHKLMVQMLSLGVAPPPELEPVGPGSPQGGGYGRLEQQDPEWGPYTKVTTRQARAHDPSGGQGRRAGLPGPVLVGSPPALGKRVRHRYRAGGDGCGAGQRPNGSARA